MEFGIWGLGFKIRTSGYELRASIFGLRFLGYRLWSSGFGFRSLVSRLGTPCFVVLIEYRSGHSKNPLRGTTTRVCDLYFSHLSKKQKESFFFLTHFLHYLITCGPDPAHGPGHQESFEGKMTTP